MGTVFPRLVAASAAAATFIATAGLGVAGADAAALLPAPRAAAAPGAPTPTRIQIDRAVTRATQSPYLWATVNVCVPQPHAGGVIGIRGEMPALGLSASLSMTITLEQYVGARRAYVPVSATTAQRTVTLGTLSRGIHQDGAEFPYAADTGLLAARVTFTWTRDGRRLLQVARFTTGGHPSAAYGMPAGHSTASCRL